MRLFQDRWAVWLGRIAFASFVVVMLSGVFLLFHYDPSTAPVRYDGPYLPLAGGVMLRVFFAGLFRGRLRVRWLVLVGLWLTALAAGFTGAVLPDDLLSGTSLAIFDGVLVSIPFVGTRLSALVFGDSAVERMFPLHVVVLPVLLTFLFVASGIVSRVLARARRRSIGFGLIVAGVLTVMAGTVTINPVWLYGPADPGSAFAGASPEWYLGFVDGALRLVPPDWEFVWLGRTWAIAVLLPVFAVTVFLLAVAAYPYAERWLPRDNATRAGVGVAGMTFYGVLWTTAAADTIALHFHLTIETVLHTLQVLVLLGPVVAFLVTRALARVPRREPESGVLVRTPDGGHLELTEGSALLDRGAEPAKDAIGVGPERVVVD